MTTICCFGIAMSILISVGVFFIRRQILSFQSRIMMTYLDVPFRQAEKHLLSCQNFLESAKVWIEFRQTDRVMIKTTKEIATVLPSRRGRPRNRRPALLVSGG